MQALGIDIGGSGIKGAPIDITKGKLLAPRFRIPTPKSAKVLPMVKIIQDIIDHFKWNGPIGCGFPGSLRDGVVLFAGNMHSSWIGSDVKMILEKALKKRVAVINDADAAGIAEMKFGAGKDRSDVVLLITVGTGIGTAVFVNGHLMPNSEFGHIEIRGKVAEKRASDGIRKKKELTWQDWATRFDEYLNRLNQLIWPKLIILGGGISKKFDKYQQFFTVPTEVVPAQLKNEAGLIGAALATLGIDPNLK